jgi:hypothetical protein
LVVVVPDTLQLAGQVELIQMVAGHTVLREQQTLAEVAVAERPRVVLASSLFVTPLNSQLPLVRIPALVQQAQHQLRSLLLALR